MRSLLLPLENIQAGDAALTCALQIARRFKATVSVMALQPIHYQVVGAEPVVAVTFPPSAQEDAETYTATKSRFEQFVAGHSGSNAQLNWSGDTAIDDNQIASLARVYDATIVGRPSAAGDGPRMATLESALFDGGRAILVVPPKPKETLGNKVVIAWNQSTESARTVAYALPFLRDADAVTILTIEGAVVPGPDGKALKTYLSHHDIAADEITVAHNGRRPGIAILEEAEKLGCDLLIKGAYTQSRLRQMILGGATSQILADCKVPVFMAN